MQNPLELRYITGVHQITPHLTLEWLNPHIYEIIMPSSHREAIDDFVDLNTVVVQGWPQDEPYLTLANFTHPDAYLTPYFRTRAAPMWQAAKTRDIWGGVATAVHKTGPVLTLGKFFVNTNSRLFDLRLKMVIETDRDKALAWLNAILEGYLVSLNKAE